MRLPRLLALLLIAAPAVAAHAECPGASGTIEVYGFLLAPANEGAHERRGRNVAAARRLELGSRRGDAIAALRFEEIGIPPGAVIEAAQLALVSARKGKQPAELVIWGEAGDAAPFGAAPNDLAERLGTAAEAAWSVPPWTAAGTSVQSPDLRAVVQEIVDGPGWEEGDAMAFFASGTGKRSVVVFEAGEQPPLLLVDFVTTEPTCEP